MKEQVHAFLTQALGGSCQRRVNGVTLSGKQPTATAGCEAGTDPTAQMSKLWQTTKPSTTILRTLKCAIPVVCI